MASKIDRAIEVVETMLEDYRNPSGYEEPEYYARCDAKADACSDILYMLKQLRDEKK